jgi:alpha-L-fucosidase 2
LIFEGRYSDAHKLIDAKMMARPLRQMPYQTAGDFLLTFPEAQSVGNYRRELNIDTAVASVNYTVDGVQFSREIFSSPVDQVIVIRLTANKPGSSSKPSRKTRRRAICSGIEIKFTGKNFDCE